MTIFEINIVSDTVCPWCYIGYKRLQKSIALYQKTYPGGSKDVFQITWKPYFLDDEPPKTTMLLQDRMVALLGAKGTAEAQQYLQRVGAGESINFKFGGPIGNSRPSHVLLHLAKSKSAEIQTRVAEQLFRAHFEDEKDITATEVLVEAGVEAGLERNEIVAWLEGNQLTVVEEEEREVKGRGIKGVPQFVIAGKQRFEGASDVMDLFEAFIEYKEGKE